MTSCASSRRRSRRWRRGKKERLLSSYAQIHRGGTEVDAAYAAYQQRLLARHPWVFAWRRLFARFFAQTARRFRSLRDMPLLPETEVGGDLWRLQFRSALGYLFPWPFSREGRAPTPGSRAALWVAAVCGPLGRRADPARDTLAHREVCSRCLGLSLLQLRGCFGC
jgi:hypothetical protein